MKRSRLIRLRRYRYMRIHLHSKTAAALALALGAVTAGPAAARFDLNPAPTVHSPSTHAASIPAPSTLGAALAYRYEHRFAVPRSSVVSHGISGPRLVGLPAGSSFAWGDAGIGAAGGLALSLVVIGGGLAVTERRRNGLPGRTVEPAVGL
jgi:hypothetical protein